MGDRPLMTGPLRAVADRARRFHGLRRGTRLRLGALAARGTLATRAQYRVDPFHRACLGVVWTPALSSRRPTSARFAAPPRGTPLRSNPPENLFPLRAARRRSAASAGRSAARTGGKYWFGPWPVRSS